MVASVSRRVKCSRSELRSLQAAANKMILSQEEMVRMFGYIVLILSIFACVLSLQLFMKIINQEEVVLKRCWLARYWTLSSKLGTKITFALFILLCDEGVFRALNSKFISNVMSSSIDIIFKKQLTTIVICSY